jgi:hypothetical protein
MNSLKCLKVKWSHSRVIVFEGARSLLRCFWCAEWLCKPFTALCSYYFATNAMVVQLLNLLQHIAENQNVLPHISSRALRGHTTEKGKILSL